MVVIKLAEHLFDSKQLKQADSGSSREKLSDFGGGGDDVSTHIHTLN